MMGTSDMSATKYALIALTLASGGCAATTGEQRAEGSDQPVAITSTAFDRQCPANAGGIVIRNNTAQKQRVTYERSGNRKKPLRVAVNIAPEPGSKWIGCEGDGYSYRVLRHAPRK